MRPAPFGHERHAAPVSFPSQSLQFWDRTNFYPELRLGTVPKLHSADFSTFCPIIKPPVRVP
jgi:hypothetical protein